VEKALRLDQADRQRLQVALTSLGFDTRGNDGVFGPRSRDMIAGWQKKAGAPASGFLTAAQRDQLLRAAATAVTRWDEEQKKIEEEKKAATANTVPVFPSPAPVGPVTTTQPSASAAPAEAASPTRPPDATRLSAQQFDGTWTGTAGSIAVTLTVTGTKARLEITCFDYQALADFAIGPDGAVNTYIGFTGVAGSRMQITGTVQAIKVPRAVGCGGGTVTMTKKSK